MIEHVLDDRYRILEQIHTGGLSTIYRARDLRTDVTVAVKVLHPHLTDDPAIGQRFLTDGQTLLAIPASPHVVRVLDVGKDDGTFYLVMEYLTGQTLDDLLRQRGPLPIDEVVTYGQQALAGIEAIHDTSIVHGDLSPRSMMLNDDQSIKILGISIPQIQDAVIGVAVAAPGASGRRATGPADRSLRPRRRPLHPPDQSAPLRRRQHPGADVPDGLRAAPHPSESRQRDERARLALRRRLRADPDLAVALAS